MASSIECWKRMLWFKKRTETNKKSWLIENKTKLLEGLLAASNGACDMPFRVFTVKEVSKATNGNLTTPESNFAVWAMCDGTGHYIRGSFQGRPVLVKKFHSLLAERPSYVINDIVVSLQMNHHKNVLNVLGCCLDVEVPVIIYDHARNDRLLSDILFNKIDDRSLSWRERLKIAIDIANAVVHLHTGFCTPTIHRDLGTKNVVIDQYGIAKLLDFSLCISLPPGESQIEDMVIGTKGHVDPEYATTGIVTLKSDVYMFGVIALELLTGQRPLNLKSKTNSLLDHESDHVDSNQLKNNLDPIILGETRETEKAHQLQTFVKLALRCTRYKGEDRPDMIEVAKELRQLGRSNKPH
ncbi:hypothetical protein Pfo_004870 [Paulownia fortunei]|nr:hypothetical protein Pfo_004870 [Paulownia fortunei]